ncbi:MAG: apolipoprotein N-acyltransferase, partial [Actinobacteria bacterium]|nr:apolipoprotein N-acyltransferase [Actinomycetota bacterium]
RLHWAALAALAGGLALAAAFPPAGIWPLAVAGPALLAVALWRQGLRASLLIGLIFGAALFVPLLSWVLNVAWYAWAALAGADTVVFAVLVLGLRLLLRLPAWPLAFAGWWVAAEGVRDRWPWGGFPWGRLAMSQASAPDARWAAIGGAPLVTFLVALTGGLLAWLLLTRPGPGRGWRRRRPLALPAVTLAVVAGLAAAGPLLPPIGNAATAPAVTIAAVQGNVPHARDLPSLLRATTVTANHATATQRLAAQVRAGRRPAPDLVIWPENSTDIDPMRYPPVYREIAGAAAAIGRPLLVGAILQDPVRNAGLLWLPGRGPVAAYVKRQLVPFGEVIPFRGLLSHITSLVNLQPRNFTPGHGAVVFRTGKVRLGDVICYEVGFDGLVHSEVTAGANLLAVQTNDATFEVDGQLGETLQQLAMARIRAIETGRAVVVASTTGVSAVIAPDGTLIAHTRTWRQAVLEARVPLLTAATVADRIGAWPEYVIIALTVAALAGAAAGAGRERRPGRPAAR